MNKITYNDIPDDLEEMLEEHDIMYTGSEKFDDAMLSAGYFAYGGVRRSHRIITQKAKDTDFWSIVEELTGVSKEEHIKNIENDAKVQELHDMFEIAKKYGYIITKG